VFFIGASIPTVMVIAVWLVTFMSFSLKEVLHSEIFQVICTLTALVWGICVSVMEYKEVEEICS
jgi:hypothetical protein